MQQHFQTQQEKKRYRNAQGGFVTGFNVLSEEQQKLKEKRAQKFAIHLDKTDPLDLSKETVTQIGKPTLEKGVYSLDIPKTLEPIKLVDSKAQRRYKQRLFSLP